MKSDVHVPMSKVTENMTVSVRVTGVRRWHGRWWLALKLLALAEWIIPSRVEREAVIEVGDRIQISVELLKDWVALPGLRTEQVKVVDVRVEADGSKTPIVRNLRDA